MSLGDRRRLSEGQFGEFVKAVVDVGRGVMAGGGERHADEDAAVRRLIENVIARLVAR